MIRRALWAAKQRIEPAVSAVVYFLIGDMRLLFDKDSAKKLNLKADDSSDNQ